MVGVKTYGRVVTLTSQTNNARDGAEKDEEIKPFFCKGFMKIPCAIHLGGHGRLPIIVRQLKQCSILELLVNINSGEFEQYP